MPRPRRPSAPEIRVLRLGHRAGRDPRLTTHVALAARALGAAGLFLEPPDPALADRLRRVTERWGGKFQVDGVRDWRGLLRKFEGTVLHLTMYGEPLDAVIPRIDRQRPLLVVVGGAKVPADLYRLATFNVAVGHQPHSEVAALAIVLDRLGGLPPAGAWEGATHEIVPRARGKEVRRARREPGPS
ncbi:MAG TPA: tRNA (cytidine(56)-2'-O)-methyltransferase [Thermoplasmata archaeon]|nr:tRNA (cytidine(56)-2'-O)-methyltransferase [Thermoplasmata archaeon]